MLQELIHWLLLTDRQLTVLLWSYTSVLHPPGTPKACQCSEVVEDGARWHWSLLAGQQNGNSAKNTLSRTRSSFSHSPTNGPISDKTRSYPCATVSALPARGARTGWSGLTSLLLCSCWLLQFLLHFPPGHILHCSQGALWLTSVFWIFFPRTITVLLTHSSLTQASGQAPLSWFNSWV